MDAAVTSSPNSQSLKVVPGPLVAPAIQKAFNMSTVIPFNRLSSDILLRILRLAMSNYLGVAVANLDTKTGIWRYSKVCSTWRRLIISNQPLWSQISISETISPTFRPTQASIQILNTIFQRSGQKPLVIDFSASFVSDPKLLAIYVQLLQTSMSVAHRWLDVTFALDDALLRQLGQLPENSVPLLQSLSIHDSSPNLPFIKGFQTAPQLNSVTFMSTELLLKLKLPLSQISHVSSFTCSPGEALSLLRQAPNLLSCSFGVTPRDIPTSGIEHSQLKRLRLFSFDNRGKPHVRLLDLLRLPALENLEMTLGKKEIAGITSLVRRSRCPLQVLTIRLGHRTNDTVGRDSMFQLSQCATRLTTLDISMNHSAENLQMISYLTAKTNPALFPNLVNLSLRVNYMVVSGDRTGIINSTDSSAILDMIRSRGYDRGAGVAVTRLRHLDFNAKFDTAQARDAFGLALQPLKDQGLKVFLKLVLPSRGF
ncbi:hypothetical protein C8J56DRAFT_1081691 [Mycena floridula]|nr:hypothetical protein C8J56DRAFT_1081691 [Mycena floridula]